MNWYQATFKRPNDKENPRFCSGRMTFTEFACLHLFILINSLVIVGALLMYFYLIPIQLQEMLDSPSSYNRNPTRISRVAIGPLRKDGFKLDMNVTLSPFIHIPIYAGIGDVAIRVTHQSNDLFIVNSPGGSIWLNEQNAIQPALNFSWDLNQEENMQSFLASYSNYTLNDSKLVLYFCPEIKLYSLTLYRSLCLHYTADVDYLKPANQEGKKLGKNVASSFVFEAPDTKSAQDMLTANFGIDELSSLSADFKFMWKKLFIYSNDDTISFEFVAEFVNPTVFELALIEKLDFFIELMGTRVGKVSLVKLGLSPALNNAFDMRIDITFISDSLDSHNTQLAIEQASRSYAESQDFQVAFSGPFNITKAGFATLITEKFKYTASFKDTLSSIYSHSQNADSLTFASLLEHSNISISILSDQLDAFLGIQLPALSSLKPPLNYSFPFFVGFDLYSGDASPQKLLHTSISPVVLQKSSQGFGIETNASVVPVNSLAAAAGLASSINPLFSRTPSASKVGFKDFSLSTDGLNSFLWCKKIFGERVIILDLNPSNQSSLMSLFGTQNNSKFGTLDGNLDITQLHDQPGFRLLANMKINDPPNNPNIKASIGYLSLQSTIESIPFASLELPFGVHASLQQASIEVDANAFISRNPNLPQKFQKLVDYYLSSANSLSYVGLSGLIFGSSPSNNIVTFSQIVIEIESSKILGGGKSLLSLAPSAIKLEKGDIKVHSVSQASIAIAGSFINPFPCTIALGEISFDSFLERKQLLSVSLSPLYVGSGKAPLNLQIDLKSDSFQDEDLAEKVKILYMSLFKGSQESIVASISNIVLKPLGSSEGIINQFQTVKITSKMTGSRSFGKIVDYSSISESRSNAPVISSINHIILKAQPNQTILAGSDVSYSNPYPLSIDIPYLSLSSLLNEDALVNLQLSSFKLANLGNGYMSPRAQVTFYNHEGLPEAFSNIYADLSSRKQNIRGNMYISNFQFGESSLESNVLLSKIPFEITSTLKSYFSSDSSSVSLSKDVKTALEYANVRILPADTIGFTASTSIISQFTFDIEFPYLSVVPGIDGVDFGFINSNLSIQSEKLSVGGEIQIFDTDQLADCVDQLYQSFETGKVTPATLGASKLVFGYSLTDSIQLFSKISLEHKVDDISGPEPQSLSSSMPSIKLNNVSITGLPNRAVLVDSQIEFINNYTVTVSGLGYFASSIGLDEVSIVDISSSGAEISHGSNQLNAYLKAFFPSSPDIQNKVASFGSNLWNNYGNTSEKISCNRILFGVDEQDYIRAFSKIKILVDSSKLFSPNDGKPSKISQSFSLSHLALKFNPSNMINAAFDGVLDLSYHLKASMPFFSFGGDVDSHHLFDINLNDLSLSEGSNNLSLSSEIYLQDNTALSTRIGKLYREYSSGSNLSGLATGGFLKFGIDRNESNVVDTFSKLQLGMELEYFRSKFLSPSNSSSINDVNLVNDKLILSVLPGKVLSAEFGAIFNSSYPISIEGLDIVSSNIEIDEIPILNLKINGIKVSPGNNELILHSSFMFESGDLVASSLSKLYDTYQGQSPITSNLTASNTIFGFDSQHAFTLFSKCKFNGASNLKSLLNSSDSSSQPLFTDYLLSKLHLNTLSSGELHADTAAKLKNSSIIIGGQIGFLQANSLIDNVEFAKVSISKMNAIHDQQDIDLDFSGSIRFSNDSKSQDLMNIVFDKYWNRNIIDSAIQITGLLIGSDQSVENIIDAFSKIQFKRNLENVLSFNNSPILPAGFTYNATYIDLDLYDDNVLSSKCIASISPGHRFETDFDINIPLLTLSVLYNQSDFITFTLADTTIHNSIASATLLLKSHGNKPAWNSIVNTIGLIGNREVVPIPDILRFQGLAFGSLSSPIRTFSKVSVIEPLNNVTSRFVAISDQKSIVDLHIEVHPVGLLADLLTTFNFPNFHNNLEIVFQSHFHANRIGPVHPYFTYKIIDISLPKAKMLIEPILTNNSASIALSDYFNPTDYLAEDLSHDSRYGYVSIKSKKGKSFTDFSEAYMYGQKGHDWNPYVLDFVPPNNWKWDVEHAGNLNGPFNVKLKFHNFGISHIDIGDLFLHINVSGKPLVTIESVRPVKILNYLEGAATYEQAKFPEMGELEILWPKEFYGEFWITHVIGALFEARKHPSHVTFEYGAKREGALMPYINQVIDNMPKNTNTNSSFSICTYLNVMRLEIFGKPDWEYPLLVPFEHSINNLFLHCNFTAPAPIIPLQRFLEDMTLVNSKQNQNISF